MTEVIIIAVRTMSLEIVLDLLDVLIGINSNSGVEFRNQIVTELLALVNTGFHGAGDLVLHGPRHLSESESQNMIKHKDRQILDTPTDRELVYPWIRDAVSRQA